VADVAHTTVGTEVPAEHQEATAFGLNAGAWVALAMLVVFAILIWKKVPGAIAKSLDDKIAGIRAQLDEAKALRAEAEALKQEYQKKSKAADKEAKAMIERAQHEAEAIVAKANSDAQAMIERRARMAEDKIAGEERSAIAWSTSLWSSSSTGRRRICSSLIRCETSRTSSSARAEMM
jgi:F-type H+-transporting ATPase subunit b